MIDGLAGVRVTAVEVMDLGITEHQSCLTWPWDERERGVQGASQVGDLEQLEGQNCHLCGENRLGHFTLEIPAGYQGGDRWPQVLQTV